MRYKLYVRNQYLNRVAEIDDFQSLEMVLRFNATGSWALNLPTNTVAAEELIKPLAGIQVVRDGKTILSGPVKRRQRKWDSSSDQILVSGPDDLVWLQNRKALPVVSGPPYTDAAYDVQTGNAETVMHYYVAWNAGDRSKAERKVRKLISAVDEGKGKVVTGRARFDDLNQLVNSLALAGGDLGYKIIQVGNDLVFSVYQPKDKTNTAVFSPLLGNLVAFDYTIEDAEVNYVIVGGGGEGAARTFVERGDSQSITNYDRIESFIDRRDTTNTAELQQAIDEELASKAEKMSLNITPIDTEKLAFGRDYALGDKVSIVVPKPNTTEVETIQDVIRELKISLKSDGETVTPVIGTPESISNAGLGFFEKIKKMNNRVSKLERR